MSKLYLVPGDQPLAEVLRKRQVTVRVMFSVKRRLRFKVGLAILSLGARVIGLGGCAVKTFDEREA